MATSLTHGRALRYAGLRARPPTPRPGTRPTITKPVGGSVTVKIAGSPVTPAAIDTQTGRITFASALASAPTTSFQFDVPVRFDTDSLPVQANAWDLQIVNNIDLVEVLE